MLNESPSTRSSARLSNEGRLPFRTHLALGKVIPRLVSDIAMPHSVAHITCKQGLIILPQLGEWLIVTVPRLCYDQAFERVRDAVRCPPVPDTVAGSLRATSGPARSLTARARTTPPRSGPSLWLLGARRGLARSSLQLVSSLVQVASRVPEMSRTRGQAQRTQSRPPPAPTGSPRADYRDPLPAAQATLTARVPFIQFWLGLLRKL